MYQIIGLIAEPCKESFKKTLDEQMPIISAGVMDPNIRVQHAALDSLGKLMAVLAPSIQVKYHADLAPKLIELMKADSILKLKTQATLTTLNFC
jgi:hypothetical protein